MEKQKSTRAILQASDVPPGTRIVLKDNPDIVNTIRTITTLGHRTYFGIAERHASSFEYSLTELRRYWNRIVEPTSNLLT